MASASDKAMVDDSQFDFGFLIFGNEARDSSRDGGVAESGTLSADLASTGGNVPQPSEGQDYLLGQDAELDGPEADPAIVATARSNNQGIDGLLHSVRWASTNFTYSFPTSGSQYGTTYGNYNEHNKGFQTLDTVQQSAMVRFLGGFAAVANMTFTAATGGNGDIRFAESDAPPELPAAAFAYLPNSAADRSGGDVWFNHTNYEATVLVPGSFGWRSAQHELGHALGLRHGHDSNNPYGKLPAQFDGHEFSLMTYNSYIGDTAGNGYENETYGHPQTLMMYDIAALQYLYGANFGASSNNTNTTYSWSPTTGQQFINGVGQIVNPSANRIFMTLWDGGGNDTYDFSSYTTNLRVNLSPGEWTITSTAQLADLDVNSTDAARIARGNIANALLFNNDARSLIENAVGGSGADTMTGNSADNTFRGNGGNDTINGAGGTDTAVFAGQRSAYQLNDLGGGSVQVVGPASSGTDTLSSVERLVFDDQTVTWPPTPTAVLAIAAASANKAEGTGGTTAFTFTVTRTGSIGGSSSVAWTVSVGQSPSTNASDFSGTTSGTLTWGANDGSNRTITVNVVGDAIAEPNENFSIVLSNASGASLNPQLSSATGVVQNDDQNLDDYADSLADTTAPFGQVAANGSSTGNIESAGDRDWFRVQLTASTSYLIQLDGLPTGAGTLQDPFLRLRDANGALLAENDDAEGSLNSLLSFAATATGSYYIEAGAYADSYAGTYRITVVPSQNDDYRDSFTDMTSPLGQVAVNGSGIGNLEVAADRDWFQVQLAAGTAYVVELRGLPTGAGTLADPYLRLYDGNGTFLTQNDDNGTNLDSRLTFTAGTTGTFYLEAGAFGDGYAGTYALHVTGMLSDDFADSFTDTASPFGLVSVGGSRSGDLESVGDRDWISVVLRGGIGYTIDLEGSASSSGSLSDPYLRLYNGAGTLLVEDDDSGTGLDSRLTFTPAASGTYYVAAAAFSDTDTGTYRIRVSGPLDDASLDVIATGDFNGDGKTDLLLRNDTGRVNIWTMDGGRIVADSFVDATPLNWHIVTTADFNGDGKSDVLLRNDNGRTNVWTMDGGRIVADSFIDATPLNWHIVDTADFNGDGKADVLLRNDNGRTNIWTMDGGRVAADSFVDATPLNWHIVDTADFNGDGKTDVLLRNDNGRTNVWTMDGGRVAADSFVDATPLHWHIVDTADFNGDGKSDVLLRNDSGRTNVWTMDGGRVATDSFVDATPLNWHIVAVDDFNADNKADVLLRNDNGRVNMWTMDGGRVAADSFVDATPLNWHIADTDDFGGDHRADVLLRNDAGRVNMWTMDGSRLVTDSFVDATPLNWQFVEHRFDLV